MLLISHRGNLEGPNPDLENYPFHIEKALDKGFNVEVDIWNVSGKWLLGHDMPQYSVSEEYIFNKRIIFHAKNFPAFLELMNAGFVCFWNCADYHALIANTSLIWTHTKITEVTEKTIYMMQDIPKKPMIDVLLKQNVYGICSDHICEIKEMT